MRQQCLHAFALLTRAPRLALEAGTEVLLLVDALGGDDVHRRPPRLPLHRRLEQPQRGDPLRRAHRGQDETVPP